MPAERPARATAALPARLRITALSVADTAKILTKVGGKTVTEATIRANIEAGAPVNADGTLNLIHYAAWQVRELASRGD